VLVQGQGLDRGLGDQIHTDQVQSTQHADRGRDQEDQGTEGN